MRPRPSLMLLPLLAITGCGDEDPAPSAVKLDLNEFSIAASSSTAAAGPVTFEVINRGHDLHEVVVVRTDLAAGSLPKTAEGGLDEKGAGMIMIGEIEDIRPGGSARATYTLAPGRYLLVCNITEKEASGEIEQHFKLGMYAELIVR